jgi:hypothetical protein
MYDMQALKFIEQRSIATEFGFLEMPLMDYLGLTSYSACPADSNLATNLQHCLNSTETFGNYPAVPSHS